MQTQTDPIRRAAVLLVTLDRQTADRLLEQMAPERAQQIRDAVLSLQGVDPDEQRDVIAHFLQAGGEATDAATAVGVSVQGPSDAVRSARMEQGEHHEGTLPTRPPLSQASERLIAECLCDELPQAIAVALAEMSTERASEVVSYLPASVQAQVLERLVQLDPSAGVVDAEVRAEFQSWLDEQIQRSLHRARLAERLAAILEATHHQTRDRIIDNVAGTDARLAEQLKSQLAAQQEHAERERV